MTFKIPKWRNFAKSGHTDSLSPVAKYFVVPKINLKGHRKSIAYWCMLLSHFSAMIYSFEPNEFIIYQPKKCFKRPNSILSYQKKKIFHFLLISTKVVFLVHLLSLFSAHWYVNTHLLKLVTWLESVSPEIHWQLQFVTYGLGSSSQLDGCHFGNSIHITFTEKEVNLMYSWWLG